METISEKPLDPTDPYVRTAQTFPTLTEEQIERAKLLGQEEFLPKGTVLFERGQRSVDFFIVLQGNIEIYEQCLRYTANINSQEKLIYSIIGKFWSVGAWARTGMCCALIASSFVSS